MESHNNPIVFISYSQDSLSFSDKVLDFSNRLRSEGIDAILDQYEEAPPEGWPRWMENSIKKADYVIIIGSQGYYQKTNGGGQSGKGLGVKWKEILSIRCCIWPIPQTRSLFLQYLMEMM